MPPVQYSYVCSAHFSPSCFEFDLRSQITGQKFKRRLKTRPKNHDYQAKIVLNGEDMKKLVFYNILCALISAA